MGANNIKIWRPQLENAKINYVLYDTDAALGYFGQNYWENYLQYALTPWVANPHSEIFNKIFQNEIFRCQFTNRYADLLNTFLSLAKVHEETNLIVDDMFNAMPDHIDRWQNYESESNNGVINSLEEWEYNINNIINYYEERIYPARYFLNETYNLNGFQNITLDIFPNNSGTIKLNTIDISQFPWQGIYFNDCGLKINAIADSSYAFSHWTDLSNNFISEESELNVSIENYQQFKAHFIKCDDLGSLTIIPTDSSIYSNIEFYNESFEYLWYLNNLPFSYDSVIIEPQNGTYYLQIYNDECTLNSNKVYFESISNAYNSISNSKVLIYPNPFKNQAIVDLSDFIKKK